MSITGDSIQTYVSAWQFSAQLQCNYFQIYKLILFSLCMHAGRDGDINIIAMGVFNSKVSDKVLEEKLKRQKDARESEKEALRRSNSLADCIEDFMLDKFTATQPQKEKITTVS